MDANEIRRQEAERDRLLSVNQYRQVTIYGTPAKGSITGDLKAAQEEIERLNLKVSELQKALELVPILLANGDCHGQDTACIRCENIRRYSKLVEKWECPHGTIDAKTMLCNQCGKKFEDVTEKRVDEGPRVVDAFMACAKDLGNYEVCMLAPGHEGPCSRFRA